MWVVFLLLMVYTYLSWKKEEMVKNRDTIRKVWYLIFVFGCLVYLSKEPHSLFSDWKSYLTALVGFIVIDSLVFLNLYFAKIGGHELKITEKQVDATQWYLDLTNNKVANMEKVLNTYEYPSYTRSKDEYIKELDKFFNKYAELEFLNVDVLPYRTEEEKEIVLNGTPKAKVERLLNHRDTFYSSKDSLMLMPLWVLNEDYVAKVTTLREDVEINDIDTNVINMLLIVYTLAVKVNNDSEGGV